MSLAEPQSQPPDSGASDRGANGTIEADLQDEVDRLKLELEEVQSRNRQLETCLKSREQKILTLEGQLATAQSTSANGNELEAELQLLRQFIWPHWLSGGGDLQSWGNRLTEQLQSHTPGSARLLLAALHLYTAALAEPAGGDQRALAEALRDLGRRLISWLHDTETVTANVAEFAELWAEHVNRDCSSRDVSVRVPQIDTAAESSWMNYNPKVGSQDIGSIQSWAVYKEKRLTAKAEVKLK
jgi:hypothetical protein